MGGGCRLRRDGSPDVTARQILGLVDGASSLELVGTGVGGKDQVESLMVNIDTIEPRIASSSTSSTMEGAQEDESDAWD